MTFDEVTGEVFEDAGEDRDEGRVAHLPTRARVRELEEECGRLRAALVEESKRNASLNGQMSELRGQRNRQARKSPFAADAQRVFEYWQEQLEPEAREFTDERFDKVTTRLARGATVEELCEAIDGCKARPFVNDRGRAAEGSPQERQTELELICRTEAHVQRFRRYAPAGSLDAKVPGTLFADAAKNETETEAPPAPAAPRLSPLDRALMALRDEFGHDRVWVDWDDEKERPAGWWSACPIRPGEGHAPMRVAEVKGHGSSLFFACAHGCTDGDLSEAVRQVELRHDRRREEAVSRARAAA